MGLFQAPQSKHSISQDFHNLILSVDLPFSTSIPFPYPCGRVLGYRSDPFPSHSPFSLNRAVFSPNLSDRIRQIPKQYWRISGSVEKSQDPLNTQPSSNPFLPTQSLLSPPAHFSTTGSLYHQSALLAPSLSLFPL